MATVLESPLNEIPCFAKPSGRAPDPSSQITICVGDLHGYYERALKLWENLEKRIGPDVFGRCTVIFLGDYCDRGPQAREVLDWLVSLRSKYPDQRQVFLAGNHDFSFAAFVGCLPPTPDGFDVQSTWEPLAAQEDREGWYRGPGYEGMHVQGRRWAGRMKDKVGKKGHPYDMSTFDSGSTFRSYGVPFGDREALIAAMPQSHKDFLRSLCWVHEQEGVDTGDPATSYSRLIAVHGGFEAGRPAAEQIQRLRERAPTAYRYEELSGRSNVYENLPEHEEENVLVVSGHHGVLDMSRRLRLIVDESGGRGGPIAAMVLPLREIVRDTDGHSALPSAAPAPRLAVA